MATWLGHFILMKRRWFKPKKQTYPWLKPAPLSYPPDETKYLHAVNEFYSGMAQFQRRNGLWACSHADPCLSFIIHKNPSEAKLELIRRGFEWVWNKQPLAAGLEDSKGCVPITPANNTPTCSQDQGGIALSATETCAESRARLAQERPSVSANTGE